MFGTCNCGALCLCVVCAADSVFGVSIFAVVICFFRSEEEEAERSMDAADTLEAEHAGAMAATVEALAPMTEAVRAFSWRF